MKISIYQIKRGYCRECNLNHGDSCLKKFQSYKDINKDVNLSCYNKVYSFEVDSNSKDKNNINLLLEKIFYKFNCYRPNDFKGHSLSVSDIIKIDNCYYYCDVIEFIELKNLNKSN